MDTEQLTIEQRVELADQIAQMALFAGLPEEAQEFFLASAKYAKWDANEVLIREGEQALGLILIGKGRVKVFTGSGSDEEIELAELGRGAVIGEVSSLMGSPATATVESITEGWGFLVPAVHLVRLVKEYPALKDKLVRLINLRAKHTLRKIGR